MNDKDWSLGFALSSRVYYKTGNLDIDIDRTTKGGFKIGEWLQWNRDNINQLSAFDLGNLTSIGMIWNRKLLGNHKSFWSDLDRFREYSKKFIDGISSIKEIKDPEIKAWADKMMALRKQRDNAYLTLREVEILRENGFPWDEKGFGTTNTEYNNWVVKNNTVAAAIRETCLDIINDNEKAQRGTRYRRTVEKEVEVQKVDVIPWYSALAAAYVTNDASQLKKVYLTAYIKCLKDATRTPEMTEFLKFINGGRPGIAEWTVNKTNLTDIRKISIDKLVSALNGIYDIFKTFKALTIHGNEITEIGYSIDDIAFVLNKFTDIKDRAYLKNNLYPDAYSRVIEYNNRINKHEYVSYAWVNEFIEQLRKDNYCKMTPNNHLECRLDKTRYMMDVVYAFREELNSKVRFKKALNEVGFFFIESSHGTAVPKLREQFKLITDSIDKEGVIRLIGSDKKLSNSIKNLPKTLTRENTTEVCSLLVLEWKEFSDFYNYYKWALASDNTGVVDNIFFTLLNIIRKTRIVTRKYNKRK